MRKVMDLTQILVEHPCRIVDLHEESMVCHTAHEKTDQIGTANTKTVELGD